jgi:23S rRNA (cytosine1962-C5)-methyltransferase
VRRAVTQRKALSPGFHSNAYRIIHSESDWLPGIIADQYGDTVVTQLLTTGAYFWRKSILAVVAEESGCKNLVERSDADVLALEGLNPVVQTYRGEIPEQLWIEEHGLRYLVQPGSGQKTGFYMDQRDNRYKIRQYAAGKRVLDCFSYSGGFAMNALSAGADQVELVDSSEQALENAQRNLTENEYPSERYTLTCENAFTYLRKLRDKRASFDLIVLDPPKLAPTHAQVERAARAYKDINLLAMKLLSRGGILFTFSCSGGVGMDLFRKIISDSALDAGRDVQVLEQMHQAGDHPISAQFPEGEYLKGLVCIVH